MALLEVVTKLAEAKITFTCWFTGDNHWTIQVKESLNNEQLKALVELGGSLQENGIVMLIGKVAEEVSA
jgi:hypothetical protein